MSDPVSDFLAREQDAFAELGDNFVLANEQQGNICCLNL